MAGRSAAVGADFGDRLFRRGLDGGRFDPPGGRPEGARVPAATFEGVDWAMVEILAPEGRPGAMANPVFFGIWDGPRKDT
jgi:hypothetical protein